MTDRSARLRAFYAQFVCARAGVQDPRVEDAFASVPREPFAGPPPWSIVSTGFWGNPDRVRGYVTTPDDDPAYLYSDVLVGLDPARGINIGEPSLHARCLDAFGVQDGETILHVGAGSGYYSAILGHLTGAGGQVHAYEIDPTLAARARANLADRPWMTVHERSGIGEGLATGDGIYVSAGLTQPSWSWLEALNPGGRLLFPLQPEGGFGGMLLVHRPAVGARWPARFVSRAGFIACQGTVQDGELGPRLAAAFNGGDWQRVESLRLDGRPDATCWFRGDGWWLSTEA